MTGAARRPVLVALGALLIMAAGPAWAEKYAQGQVWAYQARPQDAGSLMKIQQVEVLDGETVYHVSIIGVRFTRSEALSIVHHLPVSAATLNASVTQHVSAATDFSRAQVNVGIAQWREAKGGVFTIPLAQIVEIVDQKMKALPPPANPP